MIFLSESPGKRWKRKKLWKKCHNLHSETHYLRSISTQISIPDSNITLRYLMMLAAAFLSWVSNSGSCITSSRKAITLVFSSLLVSKSLRGQQKKQKREKKKHKVIIVTPSRSLHTGCYTCQSQADPTVPPNILPCLHQPIPSVFHRNTIKTDGRPAHYHCVSESSWQTQCRISANEIFRTTVVGASCGLAGLFSLKTPTPGLKPSLILRYGLSKKPFFSPYKATMSQLCIWGEKFEFKLWSIQPFLISMIFIFFVFTMQRPPALSNLMIQWGRVASNNDYCSSGNHAVMFLPVSVWRPSASAHSGLCWWLLVWSQTPCHRFFDLSGSLQEKHTRVRTSPKLTGQSNWDISGIFLFFFSNKYRNWTTKQNSVELNHRSG